LPKLGFAGHGIKTLEDTGLHVQQLF